MQRWVSYLRVSTEKQGASGLGLEAQRDAVTTFASSRRGEIIAEYVEVESGKKDDRPALARAIAHAKRVGATLLIAKLDRLARSVALISSLMETGVDFVAADMPDANRFVLHIMSAVAEYEREQISARTKAALAAAKARGVKLGANGRALADRAIREASEFALPLEAVVREIIDGGARNVRDVAAGLNSRCIPARLGGLWWPSNTAVLMKRLGLSFAESTLPSVSL
jgi:DNA invertase Pin-like site-specific DNA recombinase